MRTHEHQMALITSECVLQKLRADTEDAQAQIDFQAEEARLADAAAQLDSHRLQQVPFLGRPLPSP